MDPLHGQATSASGATARPVLTEGLRLAGVAAGAVALVAGTRLVFPDHPGQAFTLFEAAVSAAALWVGPSAGYLALGLCAVLSAYVLLQGEGFAVADPHEAAALVAFVAAGLFLVTIIGRLRGAIDRAEAGRRALAAEDAGKAALLSEMSHRVFNDLGSLTSLATLQANAAEQDETREALRDIADRIQVFAGVYKRLHADAEQKGALDMRMFLRDLCADLASAHLSMRPVALEVRAESCRMSVARAALVGLVLNEAVMNALKYAFPDDRPGTIRVVFGHDAAAPGMLCLTVTDDGVGPADRQPGETGIGKGTGKGTGMGQRLLRAMASQLNGSYALEREGAATVARLRFVQA